MTLRLGEQDKRVYAWANEYLSPNDRTRMVAAETLRLVPYIWEREGLLNPPEVMLNPRMTSLEGCATRLKVEVGEQTRLHVLLHEMAHSMDQSVETAVGLTGLRPESETSGSYHDDNWLGLYVNMLDRYIGGRYFNKLYLYGTLQRVGLTVSYAPKPRCI